MIIKFKTIFLSLLVTNSALASDGFHFDLNPTPITDVTIKKENLKELKNFYKVPNGSEFSFMSNNSIIFLGQLDFFINDDRKAIQYNLIPSEDKNPSESSIIEKFNLSKNTSGYKPIDIDNQPTNNFKIPAQYFVDYFYIQNNTYYDNDENYDYLTNRIKNSKIVIKYSDESFSIIPVEDIIHTSFTKYDTYFRYMPEFKKYFENEKELDKDYFK